MKKKKTLLGWKLTAPQYYRDMHAAGFVEAMCPHGIGHHKGVHGCDGCCVAAPKDIWAKVTDEESAERELIDSVASKTKHECGWKPAHLEIDCPEVGYAIAGHTELEESVMSEHMQVGVRVDRKEGSYRFPGTIVSTFTNSDGYWYAVVEMDTYKILHIFRIEQLKRI